MIQFSPIGWTPIQLDGYNIGQASYIEDVPYILLTAFLTSIQHQIPSISVSFNAEEHTIGFLLWDNALWVLDDAEAYLHPEDHTEDNIVLPMHKVKYLVTEDACMEWLLCQAKELVADIEGDIDHWATWNPGIEEEEEIREVKKIYLDLCQQLKTAIQKAQS